MSRHLISLILFGIHTSANATLLSVFKTEEGRTNWQYVANFSSSLLIILLSITAIFLLLSQRKAQKANRELRDIRAALEERVAERTETLNQSNTLLQQTNQLLEKESQGHKETANRLRISESYLKNILESMPLMLVGLDAEMRVTHWNKLVEKRTGIKEEKAKGVNLWEVYPTIMLSSKQVRGVLEKGEPKTINFSQRGQFYYDITVFPLQGEFESGVVIMIDDVTQRTLTENMLIQRDKMSSMGELVSTMAHDIDIPLQAIRKSVQSVQAQLSALDDQSVQNKDKLLLPLSEAVERGNQASAIINNLLGFAHSHNDQKQKATIPDVIDHAVKLAEDVVSLPSGFRFRDIKIIRKYEANLPQVPVFISELQQVFLSLFRHACYSLMDRVQQEKMPTLQIEVAEAYDAIWIKVQHNGKGLTEEEQQDIFEPFFKSDPENDQDEAEKRLSFSYFIITEHHKGQMAVTSDLNVGTTFHIQLQLR